MFKRFAKQERFEQFLEAKRSGSVWRAAWTSPRNRSSAGNLLIISPNKSLIYSKDLTEKMSFSQAASRAPSCGRWKDSAARSPPLASLSTTASSYRNPGTSLWQMTSSSQTGPASCSRRTPSCRFPSACLALFGAVCPPGRCAPCAGTFIFRCPSLYCLKCRIVYLALVDSLLVIEYLVNLFCCYIIFNFIISSFIHNNSSSIIERRIENNLNQSYTDLIKYNFNNLETSKVIIVNNLKLIEI